MKDPTQGFANFLMGYTQDDQGVQALWGLAKLVCAPGNGFVVSDLESKAAVKRADQGLEDILGSDSFRITHPKGTFDAGQVHGGQYPVQISMHFPDGPIQDIAAKERTANYMLGVYMRRTLLKKDA